MAEAREALRALLGEVRIVREGEETYAEMKNAGLAGVCSITVVAGARSGRSLTSQRIRIPAKPLSR